MTIKDLEEQAELFWDVLLKSGLSDGHCKRYDPLTIEELEGGGYTFYSYVFDHEDGGRSRYFKTLDEGQLWLLRSFRDWLSEDNLDDFLVQPLQQTEGETKR